MTDPSKPQNAPPRRPSTEFLADRRDKVWREQVEKERATSAAKTAKLRALRLAKELADKEAAQKRALEEGPNTKVRAARPKRAGKSEPS